MTRRTSTKIDTFCNHLRIEQMVPGDSWCRLSTRRVSRPDCGEHVQVEIEIGRVGPKRTSRQSFSLHLEPAVADFLVTALTKLHPPYDAAKGHESFSEQNREWSGFYGIPEHGVVIERSV